MANKCLQLYIDGQLLLEGQIEITRQRQTAAVPYAQYVSWCMESEYLTPSSKIKKRYRRAKKKK
ncbi:MAG: hypothetical protein ABIJ08_00010 [Nanoarchaeota archaeon]